MIDDASHILQGETITTDIAIIGGGVAGITIARTLANSRYNITLLESGSLEFDNNVQEMYAGEYQARDSFNLTSSRLRYFGGSSNHWAGNCMTLQDSDFKHRDWIPYSGWPIRKDDLSEYYRQAEKICEIGPSHLDVYNNRQLLPLPDITFDTAKFSHDVMQKSPPTRFGTRYREDIIQAENIHCLLNANVTDIQPDTNGKTISRVQVTTLSGKQFNVVARHYILACGGIENARLLLHANRLHDNSLGNANDLIGRFYIDHPVLFAGLLVTQPDPEIMHFFREHPVKNGKTMRGTIELTAQTQKQLKIANSSIVSVPVHWLSEQQAARFKKYIEPEQEQNTTDMLMNQLRSWLGKKKRYSIEHHLLVVRSEQSPNPDSRVTLQDEKDKLGIPRSRVEWKLTEFDRRTMEQTLNVFAQEAGRLGVGRVKNILGDEPIWPDFIRGGPHHMGTTRMHDDPKQGVVDKNCRVHGLNNLYVAGSSVFTTSGCSMPTLTIVALALRLAEHLREIS
jgi:choline dehydrogenase-like flavoprotein